MTQTSYRPDIDGLRAIAVLAVVINHLSPTLLPGGYVGVDVFFVISGYLITRIILGEVAQGDFTIARFYERRIRRIIPALFVMLITVAVFGWFILLPSDYLATLKALGSTVLFASNIFFWREAAGGYFSATDDSLNPLLHTWSLGVEEQFYLTFPLFVLLVHQHFRKSLKGLLWLGFVASLVLSALLIESKSVAVFFLTPFRAWELLAGSLLAANAIPQLKRSLFNILLGWVGLIALSWSLLTYDDKTVFPGLAALLPVLGTAAIIHSGPSGPVSQLLSQRPVVFVGLISYSLYLWHWPVIVLARYRLDDTVTGPLGQLSLLVISLVLAWLSWHFIETTCRRSQTSIQGLYRIITCFSIGLLVFAGAGYGFRGFEARVSPEVLAYDKQRSSEIPYLLCDGRTESPCMLGNLAVSAPQNILLGDSHMLAWAPALDLIFKERNEKAVLYSRSWCPPLFDLSNNINNKDCMASMYSAKEVIQGWSGSPEIILAAFWPAYFKPDGPLSFNGLHGEAAAAAALRHTIEWLLRQDKRVVLIGPVPVFKISVPMNQARSLMHEKKPEAQYKDYQYAINSQFIGIVDRYKLQKNFTYIDPISWLCAPDCLSRDNFGLIYRDTNHLSLYGAISLKEILNF